MTSQRILVGSPVRQDPRILRHFLDSLLHLERAATTLDFVFVDDNDDAESSRMLADFQPGGEVAITRGSGHGTTYTRNEQTHFWREDLIWRVAAYKDMMIGLARGNGYDGLLLLDSDLVLHPRTLRQLLGANVDIVSEVFWTQWQPDTAELPQVWLTDHYTMARQVRGEQLSPEEKRARTLDFIAQLRRPGLYEVGGLGACTLLSRRALLAGVSFREIPNVSFWGEDRHFCIRAQAIGLKLHAETSYPPLHLYRESELDRVDAFLANCDARTRAIEALERFRETVERQYTIHPAALADDAVNDQTCIGPLAERLHQERSAQLQSTNPDDVSRMFIVSSDIVGTEHNTIHIEAAGVQMGRDGSTSYRDGVRVKATVLHDGTHPRVADLVLAPDATAAPLAVPFVRKTRRNRLMLSMLVRNEADRYLPDVLRHAAGYIDEALILDDASTDDTVAVCHEALADVPHTVVSLAVSGFHQEWTLRRKQWELTIARRPDWILNLDADEIFEDGIVTQIRGLLDQDQFDAVAFRLFDMWDESHYRDDDLWQAHRQSRWLRLVRYLPDLNQAWRQTAQHCGQFPIAVHSLRTFTSDLRLKHFGWADPVLRQQKFERYMRLDPEAKFGSAAQYKSILDPHPHLVRWQEQPGAHQRAA